MILLQTLEETFNSTPSIKQFGIGEKYFLNNVDRETGLTTDALYPILWIPLFGGDSVWTKFGERKNEFAVLGIIGKGLPKGLDASRFEIADALKTCYTCMVQYEQRLQQHPALDQDYEVRFKYNQFIHELDLNLFGWSFTFNLKLIEAIPIDCDPVPTQQDYVSAGYAQPGYVE